MPVDMLATFTIPTAAFTSAAWGNQPCAIIYRTPQPMPTSSQPATADSRPAPPPAAVAADITQACVVRCERPELLAERQGVCVDVKLRGAAIELSVVGEEPLRPGEDAPAFSVVCS